MLTFPRMECAFSKPVCLFEWCLNKKQTRFTTAVQLDHKVILESDLPSKLYSCLEKAVTVRNEYLGLRFFLIGYIGARGLIVGNEDADRR